MSNEIKLDYEFFQSLGGNFADVFEKTEQAAEYAYKVDNSLPLQNYITKEIEAINSSITLIIDSFTSTDQRIKQAAQEIIGLDVYNAVENNSFYSKAIEKVIHDNKDNWVNKVTTSNKKQLLGIDTGGAWCDIFANYVLTTAGGKKCPAKTNRECWYNVYSQTDIVHGYYGTDEHMNALNKKFKTSIKMDDYVPKTGDLVYFNWKGSNINEIDHVGVIYVDPDDGLTYVLHGNFSNKVRYDLLDDFKNGKIMGCQHITVADMTTYNQNN